VNKMGRLNITVSDELDEEFRMKAMQKFGAKKGSLSEALEEALRDWIKIN
jgi:hypothetical protein